MIRENLGTYIATTVSHELPGGVKGSVTHLAARGRFCTYVSPGVSKRQDCCNSTTAGRKPRRTGIYSIYLSDADAPPSFGR